MKSISVIIFAITSLFGSSAVAGPDQKIETLWVSDQITGLMAMWERKQSRYLITPTHIWSHYAKVQVNDYAILEYSADVSKILDHWKNEHGGVIKLSPPTGEFHYLPKDLEIDPEDRPTLPEAISEKYANEGGPWFFAYRWLEDGGVDFAFPFHDEEDPDSKPVNPQEILKELNNSNAFAELQFVDEEETLIALPSSFSNFATLKKLHATLKEFDPENPAHYKAVSASLDEHFKKLPEKNSRNPGQGFELFEGTQRFSQMLPLAMIDSGFSLYLSGFNFVAKQNEVSAGGDQPDIDPEDLKRLTWLKSRLDPYRELFEGSLQKILKKPTAPAELPILNRESLTK